MNKLTLALGGKHHKSLQEHLFSGDGLEAAAILICGRAGKSSTRYCVQKVIEVPHTACTLRTKAQIVWPSEYIDEAIDVADPIDATIILIHSHPGNMFEFSSMDNESDATIMPCVIHGMKNTSTLHGTAIMVEDGSILARLYDQDMLVRPFEQVTSYGNDIVNLSLNNGPLILPFSNDMTKRLDTMTACVVGVSGTGSIVAEILARLGVGKIILIDFDIVEIKNLNRILNSTRKHADAGAYKTKMMSDVIAMHHPKTIITTAENSISHPDAIIAASEADILFSCVDTIEARYYCDLISATCVMPLVDVGVVIPTRLNHEGIRAIADICGRIDYVFPGGSTLGDRGIWTPENLHSEYLYSIAPVDLETQIEAGYIKGVQEEAPSVISLNMRAASAAVHEWIFRLFPVRHEPNEQYANTIFYLASGEEEFASEKSFSSAPNPLIGRGLREPLLGLPSLRMPNEVAA